MMENTVVPWKTIACIFDFTSYLVTLINVYLKIVGHIDPPWYDPECYTILLSFRTGKNNLAFSVKIHIQRHIEKPQVYVFSLQTPYI